MNSDFAYYLGHVSFVTPPMVFAFAGEVVKERFDELALVAQLLLMDVFLLLENALEFK